MPDGFIKVNIREGLDNDVDLTLVEIPDTARFIRLAAISVAASASNVTLPIYDYSTGTDKRPFLFFVDPDNTDTLSIRVNGVAADRQVMPFCATSEVISAITYSNSSAVARTLEVYGLVDNLS